MKIISLLVLLLLLSACGSAPTPTPVATADPNIPVPTATSIPRMESVGPQRKTYTSVSINTGAISRYYAGSTEDNAAVQDYNKGLNKVLVDYSEAGWVIYQIIPVYAEYSHAAQTKAITIIFERDVNE